MIETWPEYLRRITTGHTQAEIAERVGVGRLSVCNWFNGKTRPKAETAIAVARVYQRPPIEALLAAAYLDHNEVDGPVQLSFSPRQLAATDIGAEVLRRLLALEELTVRDDDQP